MENSSLSSKQQILCYILRVTPLYHQSPLSLIKESPPCSMEHTKNPQCELLCQQERTQDLSLQPTDPPLRVMPVSDITEAVPIDTSVPESLPALVHDQLICSRAESPVVLDETDPVTNDFIFEVERVDFESSHLESPSQRGEPFQRRTDLGTPSQIFTLDFLTNSEKSQLFETEDIILDAKTELKEEKESREIEGAMEDIEEGSIEEVIPSIFRDNGKEKEEANVLRDDTKVLSLDTTGCIKITPDVFTASIIKYLVRIDKQEFAFADDEKTAMAIINSLANSEVKKLTSPSVKVFRRDLNDGKEVHICTQALGVLVNGRVSKNMIIDLIAVPKVFIILPEPVGISLQK